MPCAPWTGQRREAVAQRRRALELQSRRTPPPSRRRALPAPRGVLPDRKSRRLAHQRGVVVDVDPPTQGAEQRLIWYSRQGRVRLSNIASEQVRSRNARCSALSVRLTAQAEAKGPK